MDHSALSGAAGRGDLVAWFQPQIDLASGRVVAAEALARWQHPQSGLVPPTDFIPVAEESGAIHEIGEFMLEQGCALAAELDDVEISVNVSPVQLTRSDFASRVIAAFERHGLRRGQLSVEITEGRPVLDLPDAVAQLERVRDSGVGVSLDDFGSGFASLKQLNALPFTELKIDQSLIRNDTEETWTRLASIVAIVRQRGMRIVAEGIETREQYERVRDADCDRGQGYFIGMPMPRSEFLEYLRANVRTALPAIGAVARRALLRAGIRNLEDAATHTRSDVRALRGIGPATMVRLDTALAAASLAFSA